MALADVNKWPSVEVRTTFSFQPFLFKEEKVYLIMILMFCIGRPYKITSRCSKFTCH